MNPPRFPLHVPNESIADNILQEVTLSLSKNFVHYFRRSRSDHSFVAALTCLRSVETTFTLTFPVPKSFVCNLPNSGRHVTSVFQGLSLSLSRSVERVGENPGKRGWQNVFLMGNKKTSTKIIIKTKF